MRFSVSDTAEYGDYVSGPRVIDARVRDDDAAGPATRSRTAASPPAGSPRTRPASPSSRGCARPGRDHQIEQVGARLRKAMPFLNPVEVVDGQPQAAADRPSEWASASQATRRRSAAPPSTVETIVGRPSRASQDGVIKNPLTYEIMTPQSVGFSGSQLTIGKLSGRRGLQGKLRELGHEVEGEALDAVYAQVIALADAKKEVTDADLLAVMEQRAAGAADIIDLQGWSVTSSHGGRAMGMISLEDRRGVALDRSHRQRAGGRALRGDRHGPGIGPGLEADPGRVRDQGRLGRRGRPGPGRGPRQALHGRGPRCLRSRPATACPRTSSRPRSPLTSPARGSSTWTRSPRPRSWIRPWRPARHPRRSSNCRDRAREPNGGRHRFRRVRRRPGYVQPRLRPRRRDRPRGDRGRPARPRGRRPDLRLRHRLDEDPRRRRGHRRLRRRPSATRTWPSAPPPTRSTSARSAIPSTATRRPRFGPSRRSCALRKDLGLYANLRPVTVQPILAASSPVRESLVEGRGPADRARADRRPLLRQAVRAARSVRPAARSWTRSPTPSTRSGAS